MASHRELVARETARGMRSVGVTPLPIDFAWRRFDLRSSHHRLTTTRGRFASRVAANISHRFGTNGWIEEVAYRLVGTCVFWAILIIIVSPYLTSRFGGNDPRSTEKSLGHRSAVSGEAVATLMSAVDCRWQNPYSRKAPQSV